MTDFICNFCKQTFKHERNYLHHSCEQMQRYSMFKTLKSRTPYLLYNEWRSIRKLPKISLLSFVRSRYFNAFVKFNKFSNDKLLPSKTEYIQYMVQVNLLPMFWSDEDVYESFLQYFDDKISIDRKIQINQETLSEISFSLKCKPSQVFDNLLPMEVLKLVIARRLTPWFLLLNDKFLNFLLHKTNAEERILFMQVIDPRKWKKLINDNEAKVAEIKRLCNSVHDM